LCVLQSQELRPWADGIAIVVAVYGVLFLDWNSQGSPDNQPFHGVCYESCKEIVSMLTNPTQIRTWFFGLTGSIWSKDQIRRKESPEEVPPAASSSK
jgi:hypothetical protein